MEEAGLKQEQILRIAKEVIELDERESDHGKYIYTYDLSYNYTDNTWYVNVTTKHADPNYVIAGGGHGITIDGKKGDVLEHLIFP